MKVRFESLALALALALVAFLMREPTVEAVNAFIGAPYYSGKTDMPYAALMCNVYMGSEYLDQMLDILKERQVRATFFIGGCWAKDNAELIARIAREGHELGNHGTLHKKHSRLSEADNKSEIVTCEDAVFAACGVRTRLFAPPSGDFSQTTLDAARDLGYQTILWTVDTIDWRDQDVGLIVSRVEKKIQNGAFVLTHPTKATAEALPAILDAALDKGIGWRTVGECLSDD